MLISRRKQFQCLIVRGFAYENILDKRRIYKKSSVRLLVAFHHVYLYESLCIGLWTFFLQRACGLCTVHALYYSFIKSYWLASGCVDDVVTRSMSYLRKRGKLAGVSNKGQTIFRVFKELIDVFEISLEFISRLLIILYILVDNYYC